MLPYIGNNQNKKFQFNSPDCCKNYKCKLHKRFASTYKFCKIVINKYVLMLRKDVYP